MKQEEKLKALDAALVKIEKDYGKGSVMKLGEYQADRTIEVTPTGSISLDIALGVGGVPKGRIIEIYGPESSGKTTVALHMVAEVQKRGGIAGFIDAEHALDPVYAKALGVNVKQLRSISGIAVALLAATLVSFTGVIGFVGLVAPHIAKFIVGGEHGLQLPLSALIGAALVLLSDTVGRSIINPVIIPVGVVISIIGVPIFIYMIMRKGKN